MVKYKGHLYKEYGFEQGKFGKESKYIEVQNKLENIHKFLVRFDDLQLGRDMVMTSQASTLIPGLIIGSASDTLHSIMLCCEYGHLADSNTLLRKYRDDLFFYLYLIAFNSSNSLMDKAYRQKHEENIKNWQQNKLLNLRIVTVLKFISEVPILKIAIEKYKLQKSFSDIGQKLNNYVHSNGIDYYNKSTRAYRDNSLNISLDQIMEHTNYITTTFVFLVGLCSKISLMSSDYIDYLELGKTPPEGGQYWVAPFITDYLKDNGHILGKDCIEYLRYETGMDI